ncbi:hypothetical protein I3843_02G030900 [Carya illinoinensis]|uniref:Protein kinase domain-containing protein n=1 Tax=Carya illinoinensis TaxID=32201 RepID=A0A8T1R920_CARIL|nr:mitogen-activated protein kinase kinase kinase 7-like [Carya illinoinensis]KAG6663638.1 hypothetical protein CIPAW_02G038800 [Carya illinoinensis]KAG6725575.1 hypothetical protein I3842_02G039100 [Carya illinoinensis]KAG7990550.1 hypothetical protein I3843_02G030900 [Carya illinoinensis]
MEQFRHIGEVLGSMKALMVFRDNIQINQRQCCLLLDIFSFAYESIAEEMRQNLSFEEKNLKWKVLEQPLREVHKIFKEGEAYIRQCLETKDWWARAITLYQNTDCIEFHIHNLLCSIPTVIEAIETAGEFSGWDQGDVQKKRFVYLNKYRTEYKDYKLFQWKFGRQYLVTQDFCNRFDAVWKEDRWILLNKLQEKKTSCSTTYDKRLNILLSTNLDGSEPLYGRLLPSSILLRSRDYVVRRRLGGGSQYKVIQWLGESFAMRHFFGDIEPLVPEISNLLSLSHPNIMHFLCGFTDEEKKECYLLMELMNKDLSSHIKEVSGPRKRNPFSLSAAVDLMLQIARGMEYLHSKKIYHGDLNPSKILVKARGSSSTEGNYHAKVSGFGLSSVRNVSQKSSSNQNGTPLPFIWYAPEVLEEQERKGSAENTKYAEKSDVYSFGMVCFELLTGKVPFEDSHLQGDKMSRNIRAGERPLFPYYSPKYLTNLTKRCWNSDPNQRLSFSSICRILRYVKRFLALNPDYSSQQDPPTPMVDYCDIESGLLRKLSSMGCSDPSPISQVPFQIFVYRVEEKERTNSNLKENSESGSDGASACGDENMLMMDDQIFSPANERKSLASPERINKRNSLPNRSPDYKVNRQQGTTKGRVRPPQITPCGRSMRMSSESQLILMSPVSSKRIPRSPSGHASDSELS